MHKLFRIDSLALFSSSCAEDGQLSIGDHLILKPWTVEAQVVGWRDNMQDGYRFLKVLTFELHIS